MFKSVLKILSCFIFVFTFLILLPSPTHAYSNLINYQGRAFDANNKFVNDGCYPVSFRIGRFANPVKAAIGTKGGYTQPTTSSYYTLTNGSFYNTHPKKQCLIGQAYVENGLFNVILDLKNFNLSDPKTIEFLNGSGYFYGISVNFNNKGYSLYQPLVDDNFIYPNTTNGSPQDSFGLYSDLTRTPTGGVDYTHSWGLATNHGFLAQGGLGAPIMWDTDNLTYLIDPADTSRINQISIVGTGFTTSGNQATLYLGDRYKYLQANYGGETKLISNDNIRLKSDDKIIIEPGVKLCLNSICLDRWPAPPTQQFQTSATGCYVGATGGCSGVPTNHSSCSFPGYADPGQWSGNGHIGGNQNSAAQYNKLVRNHSPINRYLNIAITYNHGTGFDCRKLRVNKLNGTSIGTNYQIEFSEGEWKKSIDLAKIGTLNDDKTYLIDLYAGFSWANGIQITFQESDAAFYPVIN